MNYGPSCKSASGFTLTELMIVVAIAGILAAIALPSFKGLSESSRVKTASFELYSLLSVARSEAIKRNACVRVSMVESGSSWSGIKVTPMTSCTGLPGTDGAQLKYKAKPVGVDFDISGDIIFNRSGRNTSGNAVTIQVDVDGAATPTANVRCITLGLSGMPQTRKGAC